MCVTVHLVHSKEDENFLKIRLIKKSIRFTDEIRAAANVVFVDALDDFCRIDRILSRFVDWLAHDEESFTTAFIHLCIPKLISLFIRLELIDWGPLEVFFLKFPDFLVLNDSFDCQRYFCYSPYSTS